MPTLAHMLEKRPAGRAPQRVLLKGWAAASWDPPGQASGTCGCRDASRVPSVAGGGRSGWPGHFAAVMLGGGGGTFCPEAQLLAS